MPGNFSLLKRDRSEPANPSESAPKVKSSHKTANPDKQKELEPLGTGKGKTSRKDHEKE
jgi:hypothetical protein